MNIQHSSKLSLTVTTLFLSCCLLLSCTTPQPSERLDNSVAEKLKVNSSIVTEEITYTIGGESFTGFYAVDASRSKTRPGIIIVHEWWGHNDYVRTRAKQLAQLGYAALALDMYGTGKLAQHPEDAKSFMQEVINNKNTAAERFDRAVKILQEQDLVDDEQIAAIGYCFGGGVVLNMVRAGKDLDAVVSFHGAIAPMNEAQPAAFTGKVAVFNGAADPLVTSEQIAAFHEEMQAANIDYQLMNYPEAMHSFTNPEADAFGKKHGMPLKYNAKADTDSWAKMLDLFTDVFQ